jgi:hypothetical protein
VGLERGALVAAQAGTEACHVRLHEVEHGAAPPHCGVGGLRAGRCPEHTRGGRVVVEAAHTRRDRQARGVDLDAQEVADGARVLAPGQQPDLAGRGSLVVAVDAGRDHRRRPLVAVVVRPRQPVAAIMAASAAPPSLRANGMVPPLSPARLYKDGPAPPDRDEAAPPRGAAAPPGWGRGSGPVAPNERRGGKPRPFAYRRRAGGTRTRTLWELGILSPMRLPIPPLPQAADHTQAGGVSAIGSRGTGARRRGSGCRRAASRGRGGGSCSRSGDRRRARRGDGWRRRSRGGPRRCPGTRSR